MQLRKPATAILALALSAGLAQADDAAPAAGSTLDKIAKTFLLLRQSAKSGGLLAGLLQRHC